MTLVAVPAAWTRCGSKTLDDPDASLPFIREILSTLRQNVGNASTVLGFIGAPWTLAAYAMEGAADRCSVTSSLMKPIRFLIVCPVLLCVCLAH